MAMALRYLCENCDHAIVAWDDGNPYYIDEAGGKQYAYHPDHERLERCVGMDSPHICMACGHEFMVDSRSQIVKCLMCDAGEIADVRHLGGRRCPYCKAGVFAADPDFTCIS